MCLFPVSGEGSEETLLRCVGHRCAGYGTKASCVPSTWGAPSGCLEPLQGCRHRASSAYSCMQKVGCWTNFLLCVKQCSRCWGHRSEPRGWRLPKWESPSRGAENTCCCFHAWPYRPHEEVTLEQRWARGIGISQEGVPESGTSWYTSHRKHICLVWGSSQDMRVIGARKAERR